MIIPTRQILDRCLQLVADQHRRRIIQHLRHEANGTTTFDDLVEQLSSRASDDENGSPQDRKALAIQVHHAHLPKLADHGLVEFDQRAGPVRYQPDEQVETVLDSLPAEVSLQSH